MRYEYKPNNVCSNLMTFELSEDGVIQSVKINRACPGNTLGISQLIKGMKAEEVIERFKGVRCGAKPTSCPDQLAKALEKALAMQAEKASELVDSPVEVEV